MTRISLGVAAVALALVTGDLAFARSGGPRGGSRGGAGQHTSGAGRHVSGGRGNRGMTHQRPTTTHRPTTHRPTKPVAGKGVTRNPFGGKGKLTKTGTSGNPFAGKTGPKATTKRPASSVAKITRYNGKMHPMKGVAKNSKYHLKHGTKFHHGWFYKGHHHHHWSHRCWNSYCRCWCFWDPCVECYYYFCGQDDCYYPMDYCPYGSYCGDDDNNADEE